MIAEINPTPRPVDVDPKKVTRNLKITTKMLWAEALALKDDMVLYKEIAITDSPKTNAKRFTLVPSS
jgi:hypothetical protein